MERRVVITGLGTINPIGNNVEETWKNAKNKVCGVDEIKAFDHSNFKTIFDAEVKEYDPLEYFDLKESKRLDRVSQFAIIAAREAFNDSNINSKNTDFNRVGVFVGSGIGGLITIQNQCEINLEKGNRRVSPMFIPMSIVNMPAGNIAIDLGVKGESVSTVTACSSSTHAIGEAYRALKMGCEDVILAGGSEAAICSSGIAGFENMKALTHATQKDRASIPFDKERSGFVMGEGAGVIVLEELEHAKKRNAKIYGEIIGFGATSDAYHITSPDPSGDGASRAMVRAIKDGNIKPEDIDYINAHGTSTHLNDLTETMAIKNVFGEYSNKIMISSTKGNTGHLLGAAGAVEAIFCTKMIEDQVVLPTLNYNVKDEECDLDIVPNELRKAKLNVVMSNSLGFGGHNGSIIIRKFEE